MKTPTPNINFANLVRQLLPFHKLQTNRLAWLSALLYPLQELFDEFIKYRKEVRMMMRVTSQVKIFEGYLQLKYNEPVNIKLVTYDDGALNIGLEREGSQGIDVPLLADEIEGISIPLSLEARIAFGDADFILYIPKTLDINNITADIEHFKQALINYKIIQE